MTSKWRQPQNEDDLKNEDDFKKWRQLQKWRQPEIKDDLKNEGALKITYNFSSQMPFWTHITYKRTKPHVGRDPMHKNCAC